MSDIVIRPIAEKDNVAIAAIIRNVLAEFKANKPGTVYYDPTTDDLFNLFKTPQSVYWVAELNGELAGGAGIYPTEGLPHGCCELVKLYLLASARGKGLGKQLIYTCFDSARQLGFTEVYLETMPELSNAVELYRKCGFENLNNAMGNSGHFGCSLWMIKKL